MTTQHLLILVFSLSLLVNPLQVSAAKGNHERTISHKDLPKLINKGAYGLIRNGKLIDSLNIDIPLIPASITKLVTSLVALNQLGTDYRFKTDFFMDAANNLYIKGYGDPFLVSEEVETILISLRDSGTTTINNIYIDDSSHQLESIADGTGVSLNPYDVASSALAVNFNTINIVINKSGQVQSGEPQTPLLPIMTRLGNLLPPGKHRINISQDPDDSMLLAGQLFRSFQRKVGIQGNGMIDRREIPDTKPLLSHKSSKNLSDLIRMLMLYSNNFIANQIFLQCGANMLGFPANWQKGQLAMMNFIKDNQLLDSTNIKFTEGSGLSRKNRLTVRTMLNVLELFKPHAHLLPEKNNILLKSGTLTGVYSYAGYLNSNKTLDSFTIILNQEQNNRDEILDILKEIAAAK